MPRYAVHTVKVPRACTGCGSLFVSTVEKGNPKKYCSRRCKADGELTAQKSPRRRVLKRIAAANRRRNSPNLEKLKQLKESWGANREARLKSRLEYWRRRKVDPMRHEADKARRRELWKARYWTDTQWREERLASERDRKRRWRREKARLFHSQAQTKGEASTMTDDAAIRLAIRIITGNSPSTSEGAAVALRVLIKRASNCLRAAEDALIASNPARKYKPAPVVVAQRRQIRERAAAIALSLYDSVAILNKRVGDIWYSELEAMRSESAFAASLADQLIRYAIPNQPTKVREMVTEQTLERMIKKARREAKFEERTSVKRAA
jgi:hypothetical protein